MQTEYFVNLTKQDWPELNQRVLKYCIGLADKAVADRLADYPPTRHNDTVKGVLRWDRLDFYLEWAVQSGLFTGITSRWIDYQGADILELRGKFTSLTACHVLNRDEKPKESEKGYRRNNRARNQKNQELFKEYEAPESDGDLFHIVLRHGGRNDSFAYLGIYLEDSDYPILSENIMLLASLEMALDAELVSAPSVTLKDTAITSESDRSQEQPVEAADDDSKS